MFYGNKQITITCGGDACSLFFCASSKFKMFSVSSSDPSHGVFLFLISVFSLIEIWCLNNYSLFLVATTMCSPCTAILLALCVVQNRYTFFKKLQNSENTEHNVPLSFSREEIGNWEFPYNYCQCVPWGLSSIVGNYNQVFVSLWCDFFSLYLLWACFELVTCFWNT